MTEQARAIAGTARPSVSCETAGRPRAPKTRRARRDAWNTPARPPRLARFYNPRHIAWVLMLPSVDALNRRLDRLVASGELPAPMEGFTRPRRWVAADVKQRFGLAPDEDWPQW